MKIIQIKKEKLKDEKLSDMVINVINIMDENKNDKYIINLSHNKITSKSELIIEELLLKNKNVEYVCIVECPISYHTIFDFIERLDINFLKKLIWIEKGLVRGGAWTDLIKSDINKKLIVKTHINFYMKYSGLTEFSNYQESNAEDCFIYQKNLLDKNIYGCSMCNLASLLKTEMFNHSNLCDTKNIYNIKQVYCDSDNSENYYDSESDIGIYEYKRKDKENILNMNKIIESNRLNINKMCEYNDKFNKIYNLLYDKLLDNYFDVNTKLQCRINSGLISKQDLFDLFVEYKNNIK